MSLLVVGSVAFDAIETPFGKTDKIVGGAASYIVRSASYFNQSIHLVSVVGGDFPQFELDFMKSKGVDLQGLEIRKDEKSFFWSGKYGRDLNSRETLVTELNVLANFNPTLPEGYKKPSIVMLGNLHPAVQFNVLEQLTSKPKLVVMDTMNFWMDSAMQDVLKTLQRIDVLTINDEEARQLSGQYSLIKAAKKIMGLGPKYLVIKKGEHGALLFHENAVFYAPALPLEDVFDPTGAGDTFAGGFVGYLAKTNNLTFNNFKIAIIYGSALASFCVEKFGTEGINKLDTNIIINRAKQFIELVQCDFSLE